MKKLLKLLSVVGPGIFAIGYTIGTGSVTSMAKAGADYGLGLVWVLALSCIFSGVLMTAYGRFAAVTGETALHGIVRLVPGGKWIAALVFLGVVTAQYTCLGGIMILTSGAIKEAFGLECGVFPIACCIMAAMYALMMVGRYSFFEKLLAFFVFLMMLTFIVSVFITWPDAATLKRALPPLLPSDGTSFLMFAAFVGTTMAAPTFVTRPLIVREKGWGSGDLVAERRDSVVSAALMFVVSGAVVAVATGALFAHGKGIDRILDMAVTLEPLAGRFAVALFMTGTLAAGLSSVFPIMMVAPLLIGDWRDGKMDVKRPLFRVICLVAALWGLVVPLLGSNPVTVTIAAQISNVFVLPIAVAAILYLVNRPSVMGVHRAGIAMNALLVCAFVFSLAVAFAGVKALSGVVSARRADADGPWFVVNEDNDHFFKCDSSLMTEKGLTDYVDYIARGKVTHVFFCVSGQRASFDSKTWEPIWAGLNERARADTATAPDGTRDRWAVNCRKLFDAGIDPYDVWIRRCREKGVSAWVSMRMNDVHFHDDPLYFRNTSWYKKNVRFRRDPSGKGGAFMNQLDYAHREVRDYTMAHVKEIAERWPSDGVELDWMRFGHVFKPGEEKKNAPVLDAFIREASGAIRAAGKKVAVRVPHTPAECANRGFNVVRWAREGLVDVVIAAPFIFSEAELPVGEWISLLSGTKTRLLADLGCEIRGAERAAVASLYRELAERFLSEGAHGVYLYNLPYKSNKMYSTDSKGEAWCAGKDIAAELYDKGCP